MHGLLSNYCTIVHFAAVVFRNDHEFKSECASGGKKSQHCVGKFENFIGCSYDEHPRSPMKVGDKTVVSALVNECLACNPLVTLVQ